MYEQANSFPTAKVAAGMTTVFFLPYLLWGLGRLFPDVPLPDKDFLQTFVESILFVAFSGGVMWWKRPSSKDQIVKV